MSDPAIGVAGFAVLLVLIALGVPVAVAMGAVGVVGFAVLGGWDGAAFVLGSVPFQAVYPYSLAVVPLFILMGAFASRAGLSRALYDGVDSLVGHWPGGLAMATVGACAGFGAICGSSLATVATMARVALPEMRRHGYDDRLAAGAVAAGGTLGVLIPPSILLVVYALLTEQSIARLLVAALVPGLLATALYMAAVAVQVRVRPHLAPARERRPPARRLAAALGMWQVALLFAAIIGGIYLGVFSVTEAAAVGAFGAVGFALAAGVGRASVVDGLAEAASTTAMIFLILVGAGLFNFFVDASSVPIWLADRIAALAWPPTAVVVALMLFYLVLGCFMDSLSMMLLTVPFVFPVVLAMGIDPIWFGVLLVTAVEVGLITPPIGLNLFVIKSVEPTLGLGVVMRGSIPFVAADLVRIALLVALPQLSLWLPGRMG